MATVLEQALGEVFPAAVDAAVSPVAPPAGPTVLEQAAAEVGPVPRETPPTSTDAEEIRRIGVARETVLGPDSPFNDCQVNVWNLFQVNEGW